MFNRIAVAYNESPEAQRAFASAIHLAKTMGAELRTITVIEDLPSYTAFASAADPSLLQVLNEDQAGGYDRLQQNARATALELGVDLLPSAVSGPAVETILRFLSHHQIDLLVIGLHQRSSYISRLWSTVYELAQEAPCSVLGVH